MKPFEFQEKINRMTEIELINFLFENIYLKKEHICVSCRTSCYLKKYSRCGDLYAWRCMSVNCKDYKKYKSIRSGSFFDNSNISIKMVFQIILFYVARMPRFGMINYLNLGR
ncbi:hypothetical protein DMUE_5472 [Dictyocoela muelleri]|nr:hypothetical protein DMUE_5472 [Dictyocoela muelleri]